MTRKQPPSDAVDIFDALRQVISHLTPKPRDAAERAVWNLVHLYDHWLEGDASRTRESFERDMAKRYGLRLAGDATWRRLSEAAEVERRRAMRGRCERAVSRILEYYDRKE